LKRLNVIQLGDKIGSEITRKHYPKNLIEKTEMRREEIPDSFVEDVEFFNKFFDTLVNILSYY
jgi:hypothetical protein